MDERPEAAATPPGGAPGAHRRLTVDEGAGMRLDAWLAAQLSDLSRSRLAALLETGHVAVNGGAVRKSHRVQPGDVVDVNVPPPEPATVQAEALPLCSP